MKVYTYKKCSTCRKATKWLDSLGFTYEELPIRETPPSLAELQQMLTYQAGDLRKLFNTSGVDYREMQLKNKLPQMTEAEALALLTENGNLVKRPFLLTDSCGFVGFKEELWAQALPASD
jgi:arsenate reductase